jgi:flagellar hook-associated protein 2
MSHTLKVSDLAAAARIEGSTAILDPVKGTNTISRYDLKNKQIKVTLDGTTKTIALGDYNDAADLETKLETALTSAFGAGKFNVVTSGNQVEFRTLINESEKSLPVKRFLISTLLFFS